MIADSAVIDAVTLLDNNPDYKIIRRISSRKSFAENDGRALLKGVVVDTETRSIKACIKLSLITSLSQTRLKETLSIYY